MLNPSEISALIALIDQGLLSTAERRTRTLVTQHPDNGMLWKILGVALLRQGRDALPALRKTAELMPQDAEAHGNLGAALHDAGQWAQALASLHRALSIQPRNVEALVDAANATRALGRALEAVPLYQRALQLEPRMLDAHNNLGNAYLELTRFTEATACYRSALQIKPDDAEILCNLGNVERQLGNLDQAARMSRRAIALDPTLNVAHYNLGLTLTALGQREEAVGSFRKALALNPRYVEAMNSLGNVLRDTGQRHEAMALYSRAVQLDPQRVESHWNLGSVLFELKRIQEAAVSYRAALAINGDYAPAHLSLGLALRQQRRPDEAEASCHTALAIDPNYVDALALLGELRADRGRFSEAEELFQRAIAINPDFSFAYFSIATHRKMTDKDAVWLEGAEALLAKCPAIGSEISLRYALGKYFDDVKQYDRAFDSYRQANELTKRYGSTYDRDKLSQRVDQIIRIFDPAFIRRNAPLASPSQLPIFIIGMPRSGTSLAEQILASHAAVFGAGELPFWDKAFTAYSKDELGGETKLMPDVTADYLARLTASYGGEARVVDKMPSNFLYAGLIHAAFPRARIIHMQRHPIDTCLSIYFQNFFSMGPYANDLDNLAHYYGEYVRVMDRWRAVLPASALLEIPYEGLIGDQEGWTRRMLDFVDLPWDPKCLDFHQSDRVVITASKWQVRQKINSTSAGRWKNYEKFVAPLRHLMKSPPAH